MKQTDDAAGDEDQDTGDLPDGVDEDALDQDDLDTDQLTQPPDLLASRHRRSIYLPFRIAGVSDRTVPIANAASQRRGQQ